MANKPRKITDTVDLLLNRHDNADATKEVLERWTSEKRDFFLNHLKEMEKALDNKNHHGYRLHFNQLAEALKAQKETLDKLHFMLLFTEE